VHISLRSSRCGSRLWKRQFLCHQEYLPRICWRIPVSRRRFMIGFEKVIPIRGRSVSGRGGVGECGEDRASAEAYCMRLGEWWCILSRGCRRSRRMRRFRDQELASRSDKFQDELEKLKMTEGSEKQKRLWQKSNDIALKAIFAKLSLDNTGA